MLSEADGIHVGQDDLPPEEIRSLAPNMLIGLSCNTKEQAKELGEKIEKDPTLVSYYNVGPIYQTGTKEGLKEFLGASAIGEFTKECEVPFTVMGGIKKEHVNELVLNGAVKIAVVTALTQAKSISEQTRQWIDIIQRNIENR